MKMRREYLYWIIFLVAAGLLAYMFIRAGQMDGQFEQIGTELGQVRAEATRTADYKYVADVSTQEYWPNQARYVNAIAKANRVYILDQDTLEQFKGYKPGQR